MKTGRYNIAQLLTSPEVEQIIIPELQRDYVWGERNVKGLLTSILDNYKSKVNQTLQIKDNNGDNIESDIVNYLNEEYMRLRYSTRVGFIYAYHDMTLSNQFYLIDGQQRLTTIFLVLLALYRQFDTDRFRKLYFISSIPKIDYKVREVAHNFLIDFIEYELTKKDTGKTFKDSSRYYSEYDKDTTAKSIYNNYYHVIVQELESYSDTNVESLIEYVENYIEFNYFDTNMSEQGEKLYLYMNSRGESLSAQERIKSFIIGRYNEKLRAGEKWEDWQNFFWRIKPQNDKNADRGFFEFLKWAAIIHMCKNQNTKIKKTSNTDKNKSRIEEIEDYIRIEKDAHARLIQTDWIYTYICENDSFTFEWLEKVESAVELLYDLVETQEFKDWGFNKIPWFSGCEDTIEYVILLGILHYIVLFDISKENAINVLRMAMYLKNLRAEYTLRRNPDRAVIRCLNLIGIMAKYNIADVRMLGNHALHIKDEFKDRYVLRADDLRWGYYQLDWQEAQCTQKKTDEIGQWESFFWKIINKQDNTHQELNRFLRGNHDFIIKVMQKVPLCPDRLLELFFEKIYKKHKDDELRKDLLAYGDISVYDKGGSNNIGPNWMERWCLLASNSDETYWDEFMNVDNPETDKNVDIVASYLMENKKNRTKDTIRRKLADNINYMHQKYYLWSDGNENQRLRIIILREKQASKNKARELCIQVLHKLIPDSWVWEHNFCVINFAPNLQGLCTNIKDKNTGYFMDLWYDWSADGGIWYCRIGHKEHDLPQKVIDNIKQHTNCVSCITCQWKDESKQRISIRTQIYKEQIDENYFSGTVSVWKFYRKIWSLLNTLHANKIIV